MISVSCLTEMQVRKIMKIEDANELITVLMKLDFWGNDKVWRYLGDTENNYASIGNQQSHPVSSLVEKIVNSFDAIILNVAKEMGINLENISNANVVKGNVMKYLTLNYSHSDIPKKQKEELSRLVAISMTGKKHPDDPNITIADCGEGQTPDSVPNTIVSIGKSNKIRIPIVQGKHNMGGSGVAKFTEIQIVITRKNPKLVSRSNNRDNEWAFTIIRRRPPTNNMRSSVVEYLAPLNAENCPKLGEVLSFSADRMPIMPGNKELCELEVEYGTFIKLFNYDVGPYKTSILLDNGLGHAIKIRLPKMVVPVRFCEFRAFKAQGGKNVFADGLLDYIEESRRDTLEIGFPIHSTENLENEMLHFTTYVFKTGKLSKLLRKTGVIFALNGQTHAILDNRIYSRKRLKLNEIKDDTLTVVECSGLSNAAIEQLFMNSRDRLVESAFAESVLKSLEDHLANENSLKEINEKRVQELIRNNMADNKPLLNALKKVIKNTEVLDALLDLGSELDSYVNQDEENDEPNPYGTRKTENTFIGKEIPTVFKFFKEPIGIILKKEVRLGKKVNIRFATDAVDSLLSGSSTVWKTILLPSENDAEGIKHNLKLNNGFANLTFDLPKSIEIGDVFKGSFTLFNKSKNIVFKNTFELSISDPKGPTTSGTGGGPRDRKVTTPAGNSKSKLQLPKIVEVTKEGWGENGFTASSVLKIRDTQSNLIFCFNIDNKHLKSEVNSARKGHKELTKQKFIYGMTMLALASYSLVKDSDPDEVTENKKVFNSIEDVEKVCYAYAPFILPTLNMLNSITSVEEVN